MFADVADFAYFIAQKAVHQLELAPVALVIIHNVVVTEPARHHAPTVRTDWERVSVVMFTTINDVFCVKEIDKRVFLLLLASFLPRDEL